MNHEYAFPSMDTGERNQTHHGGMTLLDYFAAKAMDGRRNA